MKQNRTMTLTLTRDELAELEIAVAGRIAHDRTTLDRLERAGFGGSLNVASLQHALLALGTLERKIRAAIEKDIVSRLGRKPRKGIAP